MGCKKFKDYRIDSARYVFHTYNNGLYFVTICTQNREHFFGYIQRDKTNGLKINFTDIGNYLDNNLRNVSLHHPNVEIPYYVIMPNHIHLIVSINGGCEGGEGCRELQGVSGNKVIDLEKQKISFHKGKLGNTIGSIKSAVTKYANENKIAFGWQERYYDRIIRKQSELDAYIHYIGYNVINWGIDEFYSEG